MDHPDWLRIALMCVLPLLFALPAGYAIWKRGDYALGNIAGMAVIFVIALWMIILEYGDVGRWTQACLDQGHVCQPSPSAFVRYAIYAGIGLIQVGVLFGVSLKVEERERNSIYSPEWRR